MSGYWRSRRIIRTILALAFVAGSGCGEGATGHSGAAASPEKPADGAEVGEGQTAPSTAGAATTQDYALKGIVRSVAPESGRVVIRHEEIPGFMNAMTMPFQPADESILGLLHPGDEVEGILHVEKQDGAVRDHQLRDLRVTKPAATRALTLDISKERVQLRQKPQILTAGEAVPDFAMTGQDGNTFKLSDLRGKVVVLTFIYTRCPMPEFCPLMDRKFSELAQRLSAFPKRAKDIRLISLSFDPENDTPEVLRKHAEIRGAMPPLWTYAVASHEELARIAPRLGLFFGQDGKEIAHNLCTAIIDPQGKLARLEMGKPPTNWEMDFLKTIYGLLPSGEK
jgi:protein SCO1/2